MIQGFDARYWAGERPPEDLRFFYGKVSDGSWLWNDARHELLRFQRDWCRGNKLAYGGFYYWRQNRDAIWQADTFAAKLDAPELPPALDFEDPYATTAAGPKLAAFAEECFKKFGRCLAYTRKSWWDLRVDEVSAARVAAVCDLWVADYGLDGMGSGIGRPMMPRGWSDWVIWQYAGDVRVPWCRTGVDLDRAKDDWFARWTS